MRWRCFAFTSISIPSPIELHIWEHPRNITFPHITKIKTRSILFIFIKNEYFARFMRRALVTVPRGKSLTRNLVHYFRKFYCFTLRFTGILLFSQKSRTTIQEMVHFSISTVLKTPAKKTSQSTRGYQLDSTCYC